MKTWLEDNWFTRLDRMFKGDTSSRDRLCEATYESSYYGTTELSDEVPQPAIPLRPDNVRKFMKLWKDYFKIWIKVPKGDSSGNPDINGSVAYRNLKQSLANLHEQISVRGYLDRRGKQIKEKEDINSQLESAAGLFYVEVLQCAVDLYDNLALECIKATADQNIKVGELPPQDREQFINQHYDIVKEQLKELQAICSEHANDSIRMLSRNSIGATTDEFKNTTFEIRNIKDDYIVNINACSNLLRSGKSTLYKKEYSTGLKGIVGRANKNKLNDLETEYGCSSFLSAMPALADGESNSSNAEKNICSEEQAQEFFRNGTYQTAMRLGYFQAISEETYSKLLAGSSETANLPASDGFPSLEALRVAEFTKVIFDNKLGGTLDLDDNGRVVLRTKSSKVLSVEDAQKLWRNLYKADVVYIVDHPSKTYSSGTPVKLALPIQVKYLKDNSNVSAGSMVASRRLLKQLKDTFESNTALAKDIISLLVYNGYVLVVDDWNRRYFLGSNTLPKDLTVLHKGKSIYKDLNSDLTLAGCEMYLRVPDIDIIEGVDRQRSAQGKENLDEPTIYLMIKK